MNMLKCESTVLKYAWCFFICARKGLKKQLKNVNERGNIYGTETKANQMP